jgi:type I restriction enzyme R subunit
MQKKRIHADNTTLMVQINQIVSEYLNIEAADPSAEEKRFDISKIDFDRLRKEFERAKNKNLLMKDLYEMVEQRLANMLKNNPLRINYYERYQKIVDEYNQDNQKDEIAIIFENLMKLVNDLDQEERRYVREGFSSDEELAIYDLITKDNLTQEETKKVKALAKTMLAKVKSRIQQLHQWTDKEETRAIIDTMIRDILYMELPASYSDEAIVEYREQIYDYVLKAYPAA